jgi:hypothetical protein
MFRPPIVADNDVRLAALLPTFAPGPAVTVAGVEKSSASTSAHLPSASDVASVLNWKSIRSTRPSAPSRHSSPM